MDLRRAAIMGVVNVTPDSFSDGGLYLEANNAVRRAESMVAEGAAIIDIGGESSRPGAEPITLQEELDRVVPVVEAVAAAVPIPISIDTSKPEVMQAAVQAGAGVINDIRALRGDGAVQQAAELQVPVCVMHMLGEPRTMQLRPQYEDVVNEVKLFLEERKLACMNAGLDGAQVIIDPGFGFGKTAEHNLELLRSLRSMASLNSPIMVGLSRKAMIGKLLNLPVERRKHASVALALVAVQNGANIVRVHDVRATYEAVRMYEAVYN